MYSVNVVAGILIHEIELNYTQKQIPVCTLRVTERRRSKTSEDLWRNESVRHRITAWGTLALRVARIFHRGSVGLFHFRIDYTPAVIRKENGEECKAEIPKLTLVDFEPLANFGKKP